MTTHLVCRDCDAEGLLEDDDLADDLADLHREEYAHDVVAEVVRGGD